MKPDISELSVEELNAYKKSRSFNCKQKDQAIEDAYNQIIEIAEM